MERVYGQLKKLPGIGSKTAQRLCFHIADMSTEDVRELANALMEAKRSVCTCARCFDLSDSEVCEICRQTGRDVATVCVVEQPQDVAALERSRGYRGLYHVLHGALSPLDGVGPEHIKLRELVERVGKDDVREVIVATNSGIEGEATAVYIARLLKPLGVTVTRIAHGLPVGAELEYADELTLTCALENRRTL